MTFVYGRFLRNRANGRDEVKVPLEKDRDKGKKRRELSHIAHTNMCYIYIAKYIYIYIYTPKSKSILTGIFRLFLFAIRALRYTKWNVCVDVFAKRGMERLSYLLLRWITKSHRHVSLKFALSETYLEGERKKRRKELAKKRTALVASK